MQAGLPKCALSWRCARSEVFLSASEESKSKAVMHGWALRHAHSSWVPSRACTYIEGI